MEKEKRKKKPKERFQVYVDSRTLDYILDIQNEKNFRTRGETLDYIVQELESDEPKSSVGEVLALTIADKVATTLKPNYDTLRIRSGYTDKNLKVLLEVMNSLIFALGVNEQKVVTRDILEAKPLVAAEKRIKEQLDHFAQEKADREKKKRVNQLQQAQDGPNFHEVIIESN